MSEPTIYALPPEPEGPVWDRNGDKWDRTGDVVYAHRREWAEWQHVASGNLGTWPAPLMRGPLTSTPPWTPEVGGTVETEEQYAALPEGSAVSRDLCGPVFRKFDDGRWAESAASTSYDSRVMASESRTILRVGWSL